MMRFSTLARAIGQNRAQGIKRGPAARPAVGQVWRVSDPAHSDRSGYIVELRWLVVWNVERQVLL